MVLAQKQRTSVVVFLCVLSLCYGQSIKVEYLIEEGQPVGTLVGKIRDQADSAYPYSLQPQFLILHAQPNANDFDESKLRDGDIYTAAVLDHETIPEYNLQIIDTNSVFVDVTIKVVDVNDNSPNFPVKEKHLELPESSGTLVNAQPIALPPAVDLDSGTFGVQRYAIISGNVDDAFRVVPRQDLKGLDLEVNYWQLDREKVPFYSLLIAAFDGGQPERNGTMLVNITVLDINDHAPVFAMSKYEAVIKEDSPTGIEVLKVTATDADIGENGNVSYSIDRRHSDQDFVFVIDPRTGAISLNKRLDHEKKGVHQLVVEAKDGGQEPLSSRVSVNVRIEDVNDHQPIITLQFMNGENQTAKVAEDANAGTFIARISVTDPDSKKELSNINVTLLGTEGHFRLVTADNVVHWVAVSEKRLHHDVRSEFDVTILASDNGDPPLNTTRKFRVAVVGVEDQAPVFTRQLYKAQLSASTAVGTRVLQVQARNRNSAANDDIIYSMVLNSKHSDWFTIDPSSGWIFTKQQIDCSVDVAPRFSVTAKNSAKQTLMSKATVLVFISDTSNNKPVFVHSFYNWSVAESESPGKCIGQVSAIDDDCSDSLHVTYALGDSFRGDVAAMFTLNSSTGYVCVTGKLDHETEKTYDFSVLARDQTGASTNANVRITVLDVNDHDPVFNPRYYRVGLAEGDVQGTRVVAVQAEDKDGGIYGKIKYAIVDGNVQGLFKINADSGEISLAKKLVRRSNGAPYLLVVKAEDGGGRKAIDNAKVTVEVASRNSDSLKFHKSLYTFAVSEDAVKGRTVGHVTASSLDRADINQPINYTITSGNVFGYFTINAYTGTIRTNQLLDYERTPFLVLNVQAEVHSVQQRAHAQVNVSIIDQNDNAPEFPSKAANVSVWENASVSDIIYPFHAEDRDSGENGRVSYFLKENPSETFKLNRTTGKLFLNRRLDFEQKTGYVVTVEARDGGKPQLKTTMSLFVHVLDVNDNSPVFEKTMYRTAVSESSAVNDSVIQVKATDTDSGRNGHVSYSLNGAHDKFIIIPDTGWIVVNSQLDREKQDKYLMTIVASDHGNPRNSARATLEVVLEDKNDNPPRFVQDYYDFFIMENKPAGSVVGTLHATDSDLGKSGTVHYQLLQDYEHFAINSKSGEIVTKSILDREERAQHRVMAIARDLGHPSLESQVEVIISVGDENDNAPNITDPIRKRGTEMALVSVREQAVSGVRVFQVLAEDLDSDDNAQLTYYIESGAVVDGTRLFAINKMSGVVSTTSALDREQMEVYVLDIKVQDNGKPPLSSSLTVQVTVLDRNDRSLLETKMSFSVAEDADVGTVIGTVGATDSNSDKDIMYMITDGNTLDTFDINKASGELYSIRPMNYGDTPSFRLQVQVFDYFVQNPLSGIIQVEVEVVDVNNNAPEFEVDGIEVSVRETVGIGTVVHTFTATDRDSGTNSVLRYSITEAEPLGGFFALNPISGDLIVSKPLDAETTRNFRLFVTATDQADDVSKRLSTTITATIFVEDENDNAPEIVSPSAVSLFENAPPDFQVMQVVAFDRDSGENGRISYYIDYHHQKGLFIIDPISGILSTRESLDRETVAQHRLTVVARDNGVPSRSSHQLLIIDVVDVNDHVPVFTRDVYNVSLRENKQPGTFVARVTASDADKGLNGDVFYSLSTLVADVHMPFKIDSRDGTITNTRILDREVRDVYTVVAYAHDRGEPTNTGYAVVRIYVEDENDHTPVFGDSCYPLSVPENVDLHSGIRSVVAIDADAGDNGRIVYGIADGNTDGAFRIDPDSGVLSSVALDRETTSAYQLVITAQDSGVPPRTGSCTIDVTVTDENDNPPKFTKEAYTGSVRENAPVGTSVLTVSAVDNDQWDNQAIIYTLSLSARGLFTVDSETGVITTNKVLDREKATVHRFEVVAMDSGLYSRHTSTSSVTVTVDDDNDNPPVFSAYPFRAHVQPTVSIGQLIIQVEASDADEGTNANIVYELTQTNPLFTVDRTRGDITAKKSLLQHAGLHELDVRATDQGRPPLSTVGRVLIQVGSEPTSESLVFTKTEYTREIVEHDRGNGVVAQVRAVPRPALFTGVEYSIIGGNDNNAFQIHSVTGAIRVRQPVVVDREKTPEFKLIVMATSNRDSSKPVSNYTAVSIKLRDVNDNTPYFTHTTYHAFVEEGNSRGVYVAEVLALDDDEGRNSDISYSIVDGNLDRAFSILDRRNGIVRTNRQLVRSTHGSYALTIKAMDHGQPSRSTTCHLLVTVLDKNINQPTLFSSRQAVHISEDVPVGTLLVTMTANDVDIYPNISFSLAFERGQYTDIDKFTGRVLLTKPLDRERLAEFDVAVRASDTESEVQRNLKFVVDDINDNPPQFIEDNYSVVVHESSQTSGTTLLTVSAKDADVNENAEISYSLDASPELLRLFAIDSRTGEVSTRTSLSYDPNRPVLLLNLIATDHGTSPLSGTAPLLITIVESNRNAPTFTLSLYQALVPEDAIPGTKILNVKADDADLSYNNNYVDYRIIGNEYSDVFAVNRMSGDVMLLRRLDRETVEKYSLAVEAKDHGTPPQSSQALVEIIVNDVNDNPPVFSDTSYEVTVMENLKTKTPIFQVNATDRDKNENGNVRFHIASGNVGDTFAINQSNGVLSAINGLDFEKHSVYNLIVKAVDGSLTRPLSAIAVLKVVVDDVNEFAPKFHRSYVEYVHEDVAIGSRVFTAHATDADLGIYGNVEYQLTRQSDANVFSIHPETGVVTTNSRLSYEKKNYYTMTIAAVDAGGWNDSTEASVNLIRVDKYAPEFTQREYKFEVPGNAKVGDVVGRVKASSKNKDADVQIYYRFTQSSQYFAINETSGVITVISAFEKAFARRKRDVRGGAITLVVQAHSGKQMSTFSGSFVVVRIKIDYYCEGCGIGSHHSISAVAEEQEMVSPLVIGLVAGLTTLVVILVVVAFVVYRVYKQRKKPSSSHRRYQNRFSVEEICNSRDGSRASLPAGIPNFNNFHSVVNVTNNLNVTRHSDVSHSASSGRGSAEDADMEDEEIRRINETSSVPDSGMHVDDDTSSEASVRNTQQYLARFGINTTNVPASPPAGSDDGDGSENNSMDIRDLMYPHVTDTSRCNNPTIYDTLRSSIDGSRRADAHYPSCEEELPGNYNWDYLLNWGPQFQPMAQVFQEIGQMKDEPSKTSKPKHDSSTRLHQSSAAIAGTATPKTIMGATQVYNLSQQPRSSLGYASSEDSVPASPTYQAPALSHLTTPVSMTSHSSYVPAPVCRPRAVAIEGVHGSEPEFEI